jgi:tRNA(fMet)-specific endonuclease VapC
MFIVCARKFVRSVCCPSNVVQRSFPSPKARNWNGSSRKAAREWMPATGSILLDTTIVVSVLRRVPGMQEHIKSAPELWLPFFALGELEYGVSHSSQPEKQRHALSLFLQGVDLLFPSETTAREYGRIKAELARAGTPIPENDLWIAAQAIEHGLPLATCDAHFNRVKGLTVLDWRHLPG